MSDDPRAQVAADRKAMAAMGFPPVALLSHTDPDPKKAGKAPYQRKWQILARQSPPEDARYDRALPFAMNTGALGDRLRLIDNDVADPERNADIEAARLKRLGPTPLVRRRANSLRNCAVYGAAEGEPGFRVVVGTTISEGETEPDRVEVRGRGQQVVAFGTHVSGAAIVWDNGVTPANFPRSDLPAVTETQITAFLGDVALIIGGKSPSLGKPKGNRASRSNGQTPVALTEIAAALIRIPANDYTVWINIGLALWHETDGDIYAMELWDEWSATSDKYPGRKVIEDKWSGFDNGRDTDNLTVATIFRYAKQYGWTKPDPIGTDPGYLAAVDAQAQAEEQRGRSTGNGGKPPPPPPGPEPPPEPEPEPPPEPGPRPEPEPDPDPRPVPPPLDPDYTPNRVFIRRTTLRDEKDIPQRPWITPGFLLRHAVTLLFGPPDQGKTLLLVTWAVALTLGRTWGSFRPKSLMRVLTIFAEENDDEQEARFAAALRAFGVTRTEVQPNLLRLVVPDLATLLEVDAKTGAVKSSNGWDDLCQEIDAFRPDVVILDPLIELHTAEENDNTKLKAVVGWLRTLARNSNLAVLLSHHVRKGEIIPGDLASARGASAIGGAVRIAYTFMEALITDLEDLGITEQQRRYFCRLDRARASQAPPANNQAEWFEKRGYPLDNGDETPALLPFTPPTPHDSRPDRPDATDR